jgi:hypothetical protein
MSGNVSEWCHDWLEYYAWEKVLILQAVSRLVLLGMIMYGEGVTGAITYPLFAPLSAISMHLIMNFFAVDFVQPVLWYQIVVF